MPIVAHIPVSIVALVFYALWAMALVLMIAIERTVLIVRGHVKANEFLSGLPHGNPSYWRLNRAHMNTTENLAIFAAIVLAGWAAGAESHMFNLLAVIVLVARIVQSVVHILSGSVGATWVRSLSFAAQIACEIWMAVIILHVARVF